MAKTPEGEVKEAVSKLLDRFDAFMFMPVQTGFGRKTVDYIGFRNGGAAFAIETKAPGEKPTDKQIEELRTVLAKGGAAFVVDSTTGVDIWLLERWLSAGSRSTTLRGMAQREMRERALFWLKPPRLLESA